MQKIEQIKNQFLLKDISEIRINNRYAMYKVALSDGCKAVLKVSLDKKLDVGIENEFWWHTTIQRLTKGGVSLSVSPLKVYGYGEDFILLQYIEGKNLVTETATAKQAEAHLHTPLIAGILATFDKIRVPYDCKKLDFEGNTAPYNDLSRSIEKWLKPALDFGQITAEEAEQLRRAVKKGDGILEPSLQHGDFTPWQIMKEAATGKLYLIDGEKGGFFRPRFYDLAYAYTRIVTHTRSRENGKNLIEAFKKKSGVKEGEFRKGFFPVLAQRVCGVQFDAVNDYKNGDDYREVAHKLIAICEGENI